MLVDSPPPEPEAEILVTKGRQKGLRLTLTQAQTMIGRGSANDLHVTDWFVSKTHAVIERRDSVFYIRDLGSWRHTLVNRVMVEESPLADGDVIQLGPTVELTFTLKPAEAAAPSRPTLRVPLELDAEGLAKAPQPTSCLEEGGLAAPEPALPDEPAPMVPPAHQADGLMAEIAVASIQAAAAATANGKTHSTPPEKLLDPWSLAESERQDYTDPESGPGARFEWPPSAGAPSAQPQPASPAVPCESAEPASAERAEIEVWEKALRNRSPLIRKQAARRLKQLTGKDYDY
jgi:pSer/pThr/pTyr-binding forkhead associated (FHA) protein